jgi:glycerol-3-phosphate acyltransferase PlsY
MGKAIGTVIGFVLMLALIIIISTFFVKLSWDYSIASYFQLRAITWTEAFFLSMLGNTLNGGIRYKRDAK